MDGLTAKDLADFDMANTVGHFLLNPADKSTRATLAHLMQDNLGNELSAWLKVIDDLADLKEVIVHVYGGTVKDVTVPPGVTVEVRDYDNAEGLHKDDLDTAGNVKNPEYDGYSYEYGVDKRGDVYQRAVYGSDQ